MHVDVTSSKTWSKWGDDPSEGAAENKDGKTFVEVRKGAWNIEVTISGVKVSCFDPVFDATKKNEILVCT